MSGFARTIIPTTLEEALAARADGKTRPVAGGTDLVVRNRRGADVPVSLDVPPLFIGSLPELRSIALSPRSTAPAAATDLVIGATVPLAEFERSQYCPGFLNPVFPEFASPAVRTLATIGGNICNASPAADLLPLLYAHDAICELASIDGRRSLPISDFITGPGATALRNNELLVAIRIPVAAIEGKGPDYLFYRKVAGRRSNALSKLSIYCAAWTDGGRLTRLAAAIGAVAPTVVRLPVVESTLIQNDDPARVDPDTLAQRATIALDSYAVAIRPIDDQRSTARYRRETAFRLLRYILTEDLPRHLRLQIREDT